MGVQLREDKWAVFTRSVDLASVAANTVANQDITVPGVKVGDIVLAAEGLGNTAGLAFEGGISAAVDTLTLRMANNTAAPIDQGAVTVTFVLFRPERVDGACNFA